MKKILLVEDDPSIAEGLKQSFTLEHFEFIHSSDGKQGYDLALKENPDLILLDLSLPGMDGTDICRGLRNNGVYTPIIMLTARKDEMDKLIGLEIGANDYITKPFNLRELMIKVKNILNLVDHIKTQDVRNYKFGSVEIDFKKMELTRENCTTILSVMEVKLLKYLIEKRGQVVTRDDLLDNVWGYDVFPTTRTVDNYIMTLRKKIEPNPAEPEYILTVYKAGYKFVG